jgi:hypothetical protein
MQIFRPQSFLPSFPVFKTTLVRIFGTISNDETVYVPVIEKETDLMSFKSSTSVAWNGFNLRQSEYQRAYCRKCLSDGIDPVNASAIYRDSTVTEGTTSIPNHIHIYKKHPGEEAPMLQSKNRSAELSGNWISNYLRKRLLP